ncbi:MAG: 2,3,4,5-tetrahydropyridine-2,6-dicarboxylate N-succinyltransferase [Legionellales bacterium]|nr:2,3,4,5-tetrahydropyridine-2,6-dicarboxylate N-succinyltransferase [Legionellales bacterium]
MLNIEPTINEAFETHNTNQYIEDKQTISAVQEALKLLNNGELRICSKSNGEWVVNSWLKKAVLLSFKINKNKLYPGNYTQFYDKIFSKYELYSEQDFINEKVRVVPGAYARYGSFIDQDCILMPSFVNIGAYIGKRVMVDTWATVGSCAQIGSNVHLSGGVGIGGVLEPIQNTPTIIEDNCFIGARSEIVEGVIVEKNSVISMGVYIGKSTKIYNRLTDEITYGKIPEGSVVVPGSLPSKDGKYSMYAAIIVKEVDEKTKNKVGLTEMLRNLE